MRHFIAARPVTTRSLGMGEPPSAAGLVAPSSGVLLAAPRSLRAVAGAVDLATVATAADHCLGATVRAKKQSSRRRVTVFGPANAKWTNATIARIMPLHACPARCGARRRGETAKLGSAPCLPSMAPTLTRRTRRVSPSQPQRARPPANGTHSSTKGSRNPPLRQRYPSLKGSSRRLSADSRRRRHLREYRHEEAFCIAFNQDHAAGEQHLSARDVEIAGKVINLIVRELDRCGGIAHGASLVGIAQKD